MSAEQKKLFCDGDAYGDCGEPALYVRHTQFAGSHPFCMFHAMREKDFLEESSYFYWEKLEVLGQENAIEDQKDT